MEPGRHTVEIQFPNSTLWRRDFIIVANKKQCITLNFRPKTVTIERSVAVKSPCPYPVNISAPSSVREGDQITFSADVGYAGQSGLNYTWTISPPSARITQGAGSPTITVDTTGVGNQRVTAILVVDDGSGDRNCRQRAQFATGVQALPPPPRPQSRSFAEFPSVTFNEDKANFDNFAVALQADPTAQGYIIVYNGRNSRRARLNALVDRSRDYVVNTRNIDRSRVTVMNGGPRDVDTIELWLVPQGAPPPRHLALNSAVRPANSTVVGTARLPRALFLFPLRAPRPVVTTRCELSPKPRSLRKLFNSARKSLRRTLSHG